MRCSRVGCGEFAVASFCFDGRAALVWLDPLDPGLGLGAGVLCARHADALTPPRGWHLQDRRTRAPRLWDDRPAAPSTTGRPRHARSARAVEAAPADALPLTDPPFRTSDEESEILDHLLDARTPLLSRAFAAVRDR
ncbi:MAG TPA: DUF3499 family protein [Acidimicrobiia bacterium]|nr:DUF3499 family protein [Acidimicrobiia bacterium]